MKVDGSFPIDDGPIGRWLKDRIPAAGSAFVRWKAREERARNRRLPRSAADRPLEGGKLGFRAAGWFTRPMVDRGSDTDRVDRSKAYDFTVSLFPDWSTGSAPFDLW